MKNETVFSAFYAFFLYASICQPTLASSVALQMLKREMTFLIDTRFMLGIEMGMEKNERKEEKQA